MHISHGKHEEVFILEKFNILIDIEKLIDAINSNSINYSFGTLEISEIDNYVHSNSIDKNHIESMSLNRINEPIVITTLGNKNRIIDGNHRFVKRKTDGLTSCEIVYIEPTELESYVEQFIQ